MNDELLTTDELASRWKVKRGAIDDYRKRGILPSCKGIPVIRFSLQTVLELEGVKLDKLSPIERKRLERENKALLEENKELKAVITKTFSNLANVANLLHDKEA